MRVVYHPDFPKDIKRFEKQYREISERLALRFREEVDDAIARIKTSPGSAGHFLDTGSKIVKEVRRRNLSAFPFSCFMALTTIFWSSVRLSQAVPIRLPGFRGLSTSL